MLSNLNFRRDMGYCAENLAMDKSKFIAKIHFYFVYVPIVHCVLSLSINTCRW